MQPQEPLSEAQQELYDWLVEYITLNQHSPSLRQMMRAMGLKSPAPVQSRLDHLRKKGYITWEDGQARTLRVLDKTMLVVSPAVADWLAGFRQDGEDLGQVLERLALEPEKPRTQEKPGLVGLAG